MLHAICEFSPTLGQMLSSCVLFQMSVTHPRKLLRNKSKEVVVHVANLLVACLETEMPPNSISWCLFSKFPGGMPPRPNYEGILCIGVILAMKLMKEAT